MRYLLTIFSFLLMVACGDSPQNAQEEAQFAEQSEAFDKVMVVHDDVMPKMSDISRVRRTLKKHLDNPEVEATVKAKIQENIDGLNHADDAMMNWMRNIQQPRKLRKDKSHDQVMTYFNDQMQEIEKVQRSMEANIAGGQMLLSEIEGE
ncbi:MAG: hypothetical protein AB8G22_25945 [Saprospiraceae bacterium]